MTIQQRNKQRAKERHDRLISLLPQISKDYQNGMNLRNIGKKYNVWSKKVVEELNNIGIKTKKRKIYSFDESYFEAIDSHEKAYWLGFLYADGCNNPETGRVSIGIQERDAYILEKFVQDIKHTGKVKVYKRPKHTKIMGNECVQQNAACFTIVNKKLSKNLANLGMFRAKSLTLVFPTESQLPKEFISSFILGYFDGDGTISLSTDKRNRLVAWLSIISSKQFCEDMKIILEKYFGIKLKYFSKKTKTAIVHTMKIQTVKDMFDFMYKNNKFYMLRKYNKFIRFFNWRKQYINNHIGVFEGKWVKELT